MPFFLPFLSFFLSPSFLLSPFLFPCDKMFFLLIVSIKKKGIGKWKEREEYDDDDCRRKKRLMEGKKVWKRGKKETMEWERKEERWLERVSEWDGWREVQERVFVFGRVSFMKNGKRKRAWKREKVGRKECGAEEKSWLKGWGWKEEERMRGQKNEKESNRKKEEKKISELKLDNKYNWTFWKMEEEKRQRWVQNTQKK